MGEFNLLTNRRQADCLEQLHCARDCNPIRRGDRITFDEAGSG
jgi:hypothetical protein